MASVFRGDALDLLVRATFRFTKIASSEDTFKTAVSMANSHPHNTLDNAGSWSDTIGYYL